MSQTRILKSSSNFALHILNFFSLILVHKYLLRAKTEGTNERGIERERERERDKLWLLGSVWLQKIDHSSPITQISSLITHHPIIHFLSLKTPQISPKPIWHLNPNMFSTPKTPKSRTHILTWVQLLHVLSEPHPSPPHPIYPKAKTQLYQNPVHHSPTLRVLCHCHPSPVWDRAIAGWIRSDTSLDVVEETTQYLSLLCAKRPIRAHESSNRRCSSVGMSSSSNIFFNTR